MKAILIFLVLITTSIFGQDSTDAGSALQIKFETRCFENLKPNEIFLKYPSLQNHQFCTILDNIWLLIYKEPDIREIAFDRLREIANQLYIEGNPVILTIGMDSGFDANQKNKDINDDNKIIYISVGDCVNPKWILEGEKAFNSETWKLIRNIK